MKTCLIPILLVMSLATTWAVETAAPATSRVAKVALSEIHDDILDLILAKPENAALKKAKETEEINEVKRNTAIQVAHESGKEGKELQAVMQEFPQSDYQSQQKLDRMVRTEVLRLVAKKYGSRFTVVLDADTTDSVIFLNGEIVDLTQTLKQAIQLNDF